MSLPRAATEANEHKPCQLQWVVIWRAFVPRLDWVTLNLSHLRGKNRFNRGTGLANKEEMFYRLKLPRIAVSDKRYLAWKPGTKF
jgi:hypothetical protein